MQTKTTFPATVSCALLLTLSVLAGCSTDHPVGGSSGSLTFRPDLEAIVVWGAQLSHGPPREGMFFRAKSWNMVWAPVDLNSEGIETYREKLLLTRGNCAPLGKYKDEWIADGQTTQ